MNTFTLPAVAVPDKAKLTTRGDTGNVPVVEDEISPPAVVVLNQFANVAGVPITRVFDVAIAAALIYSVPV